MNDVQAKTGWTERQLFEAVEDRMRSLAGPATPDLDDLIQLAAEQAFKSLRRFDGRSEPSTWLYGVCYRVLLNQRRWYRRWQLRFSYLEAEDEIATEAPTPVELFEARARARQLHQCLAHMSDKYRAVVVLHDLQELEVSEIASIVGCGALTVRSRLRDGRKQLSKLLQVHPTLHTIGTTHEFTPI